MPNLWAKASQYFSEKFSGVRTQDSDFEETIQIMNNTEKGLNILKNILHNFPTYTKRFSEFFEDLNSALKLIYEGSPYNLFIDEILCKNLVVLTQFELLNKSIAKLYSKTTEWERIFESAKNNLDEREEKRKVYDHYEKKLSKISYNAPKKEYLERNEEKFRKAASEYVQISENVYNLVENSLKLSWDLSNQVVSELVSSEINFFSQMDNILLCFKNPKEKFEEITKNINNPNSNRNVYNYDPMKFMGRKDLIKKVAINNNRPSVVPNMGTNNANKAGRYTFFGFGNEPPKKKNEKVQNNNFDNISSNSRNTNSFGDLDNDLLKEFDEIPDEFSFI